MSTNFIGEVLFLSSWIFDVRLDACYSCFHSFTFRREMCFSVFPPLISVILEINITHFLLLVAHLHCSTVLVVEKKKTTTQNSTYRSKHYRVACPLTSNESETVIKLTEVQSHVTLTAPSWFGGRRWQEGGGGGGGGLKPFGLGLKKTRVRLRAVPEIILGGGHIFFRPLHPHDTHGFRAPPDPQDTQVL